MCRCRVRNGSKCIDVSVSFPVKHEDLDVSEEMHSSQSEDDGRTSARAGRVGIIQLQTV